MRIIRYFKNNWKRLALANAVGMALQGLLLALLLWTGMGLMPATALAKATSWVVFIAQIATGKPSPPR